MEAARSERAAAGRGKVEAGCHLALGHPEFGAACADGQAGMGLRFDVRVQPEEDVDRRPPTGPQTRPPGELRQPGDLVSGLDGQPAQGVPVGCRSDCCLEVGVGLVALNEVAALARVAAYADGSDDNRCGRDRDWPN